MLATASTKLKIVKVELIIWLVHLFFVPLHQ